MVHVFEVTDFEGKKVYLSQERWKHILKHPKMDENQLEMIKQTLIKPLTVRYFSEDENVRYFYRQIKGNPSEEQYLFISVKYLNGGGFIITSFFTNKIKGLKWKAK